MVLVRKKKRYVKGFESPTNPVKHGVRESLEDSFETDSHGNETPEMVYQIFKNALKDVHEGNFVEDIPDEYP